MASCEEMLMGIFDTRNRIVRQLKEQQQLFDQALHSLVLLRGFQPPAWLSGARATTGIGDRCHPGSKEGLVPDLLIPPHKQTANYSVGFFPHNKSEGLYSIETHDFHKEYTRKPNGNDICIDNPKGEAPPQTATVSSEVCIALDHSLEKITRSRSRQRALEQRNSEKKREGDEKKAAVIENTGRVASSRFASEASRFASQQSDIGVSSMDPLKYQNGFETEKAVHPLNSPMRSIGDDMVGCRNLDYESSPRNRATKQMHAGTVCPHCVLSSVEIAEASERQQVHGSMLTIQPKELMFDDVEDCSVKDTCPDLDEQILENELLENNQNMQSKSANLTNVEDSSDRILREKVASGEDLSASKSSQIGVTSMDASEVNMVQNIFSSAEPEVRNLVDSPNVQAPGDSSSSDLQQRIDDSMSNKKASEATSRKSTNSSRKHIKSKREVTKTKNRIEVMEGRVSEVHPDATRFSSIDLLQSKQLSDSASFLAREQGAFVGTQRRITRSMSSCFLDGGGNTHRQMASATAKHLGDKIIVQTEATSCLSSDGNQYRRASCSHKRLQKVDEFMDSNSFQVRDLDCCLKDMVQETMGIASSRITSDGNQNHRVSSSHKRLQKIDDFVDSISFQVRDLDCSLKDMVQETIGTARIDTVDESTPVLNISPQYCNRGSQASYFLRSHSPTHQRNVVASHIAGSNGSKGHSSRCSKLSKKPTENVYDLSQPVCWVQPNNDNQLNPRAVTSPSIVRGDLQIQNEDAESASGTSEVVVESYNAPFNQVHASQLDLDTRFDGVEAHQSTEQTDIDLLQSLSLSQAGCSPIFFQEVEHDLKHQSASTPEALQKTLVASPHGTEFEVQVNGASDPSLINQQGSGRRTLVVLDNRYPDPTDGRRQFGGTKLQPVYVDCSVVEKASSCVSDMNKKGDAEKDWVEELPCSPEKGFVSQSCHASRTSICDLLDSSGKHSSYFRVDDSLPVFERFSVGLPIVCGEPPLMEHSNLYDYLDFSSFKTTAVDGPQLCKSMSLLTPRSNASSKYKIHSTPDIYQSLPNGLLKHMRGSFLCTEDLKHVDTTTGENDIFHEICCNSGLQLMDDSLLRGSYCGPTFGSDAEFQKGIRSPAASTPAAGKFSERILLKSNSSSSGKQFKNPELTCFRIEEEETNVHEENGHVDLDDVSEVSPKRNGSGMNMPENALIDISMSYCGSSDINDEGETFLHRSSTNRDGMQIAFAGKESGVSRKDGRELENVMDDKENRRPFCAGKSEKVSSFLPKRTSKPKLSGNVRRGNGSQAISGKDRKLNNIVANVSSFIPLIQQKKPVPAKRDVKVKALEAAEAAKRLEEKKEIERKMRKEAAKLEREKLMLENLKQMEEQKRREDEKKQKRKADLAKRQQREEEEKKDKERKRKLIEESCKQFRLAEEQELQHKGDKDEFKRKEAKRQKVEQRRKGIGHLKPAFSGTGKVGASDAEPSEHVRGEGEAVAIHSDKLTGTNRLAIIDKGCSSGIEETEEAHYEISPYRGSDDEEEEGDDMASRKFIPYWARKENLIPILCRQQHVDPDGIFPSVKGCNLNEVLGSSNFSRFRDRNGRGESGCWLNDSFTQHEEYRYKLKMGYIKL